MGTQHLRCAFFSGAILAVLAPAPRAVAKPDPPLIVGGSTAVFSGDQHLGISTGPSGDITVPPIYWISVNSPSWIQPPSGTPGVEFSHLRAKGADGPNVFHPDGRPGGSYGPGQDQLTVQLGSSVLMETFGDNASALLVRNRGGNGGDGFSFPLVPLGGNGGKGGDGGAIVAYNSARVMVTNGVAACGILAESQGGVGGRGGDAISTIGQGGVGGIGGTASSVAVHMGSLSSTSHILTRGPRSDGILAQSLGGAGGSGGTGGGIVAAGGGTRGSGPAGPVFVENYGSMTVMGAESHGIFAQSVGGHNGAVAGAGGLFAWGGSGESAGNGGEVTITNRGLVESAGTSIAGLSVGGGGGRANTTGAAVAWGGEGSAAGDGSIVRITNFGELRAHDANASGILGQSIGGGGGAGSITGGAITIGAAGGAGGNGSEVWIDNVGRLETDKDHASALVAQSTGGGGGSGGGSASVSAFFGAAVGGKGAKGGYSGPVDVQSRSGALSTRGDFSHGILAQSTGGGGGDGGWAVSVTGGTKGAVSVAVGGSGGAGGDGNTVNVDTSSSVTTRGDDANGVFAQSVGGGGGNAGFSFAVAASEGASLAVSVGGTGGAAGSGKAVTAASEGQVNTYGLRSVGVMAQSVGGGGGRGGASAGGAFGATAGVPVTIGGWGGGGGHGDLVTLNAAGNVATRGDLSYGIMAQSTGGGGGTAGLSFGLGATTTGAPVSLGLGGFGSKGGNGGMVNALSSAQVTTSGGGAHGIFAQSVGGGGGAGGYSGQLALGTATKSNVAISVGGSGGIAGDAKKVTLHNTGLVHTQGVAAYGLFAQSVGGGGGDGGGSFSAALGGQAGAWNGAISLGGFGGAAGKGGDVDVDNSGDILTEKIKSHGLVAQSIGGGGGTGGFSASGAMSKGQDAKDIAISVGGFGGPGSNGGVVDVVNAGQITTQTTASVGVPDELPQVADPFEAFGNGASAILAQSVGGGGGEGGFSFAGALSGVGAKNVALALGGFGGDGGHASDVTVDNRGILDTTGANSPAILAQSVGGGGGKGGMTYAVDFGLSTAEGAAYNLGASVGGFGGEGDLAGFVGVNNTSRITTHGVASPGIHAQSIGGGGGVGGASVTGTLNLEGEKAKQAVDLSVAVGGKGGHGNTGGLVGVTNSGAIETHESDSSAMIAQSIGGGGGKAGASRAIALDVDIVFWKHLLETGNAREYMEDVWKTVSFSMGGEGGGASNGSDVLVANTGPLVTHQGESYGILAQSIGGGGGIGGEGAAGLDVPDWLDAILDATPLTTIEDLQVTVGGSGGSSGHAGTVDAVNSAPIVTHGNGSAAIFAQSVGGGGGAVKYGSGGHGSTGFFGQIGVGGAGGAAGDGGEVTVSHDGQIRTFGDGAYGIFAQSVGGGGGIAGNVNRGLGDVGAYFAFARQGGGGGNAGDVTVTSQDEIVTRGIGAIGIFAQSVGGGGGVAGHIGYGYGAVGSAGGSGTAGKVTVTHTGDITTFGDNAPGVVAQSAAGTQSAGNVEVTLNGNIAARGMNSAGIIAHSHGDDGNGNITITIASSSSVVGGSWDGSAGAGRGVGVQLVAGADNTLANSGVISAISGTAILAGGGNETVSNAGVIAGSVDLGTGANAFHNQPGGVFAAGDVVHLGDGNTLVNDGLLTPGITAITTELVGNFTQSNAGVLAFEIGGLTPGSSDLLSISGDAALAGEIHLSLLPGYDIAAEIGPRESSMLAFLDVDGTMSIAPTMSFLVPSGPLGFEYAVIQQESKLFLSVVNTIPEPTTAVLLGVGMSISLIARSIRTRKS